MKYQSVCGERPEVRGPTFPQNAAASPQRPPTCRRMPPQYCRTLPNAAECRRPDSRGDSISAPRDPGDPGDPAAETLFSQPPKRRTEPPQSTQSHRIPSRHYTATSRHYIATSRHYIATSRHYTATSNCDKVLTNRDFKTGHRQMQLEAKWLIRNQGAL